MLWSNKRHKSTYIISLYRHHPEPTWTRTKVSKTKDAIGVKKLYYCLAVSSETAGLLLTIGEEHVINLTDIRMIHSTCVIGPIDIL